MRRIKKIEHQFDGFIGPELEDVVTTAELKLLQIT